MLPYHNDPTIKFSHSPVIQKIGFQVNQIGPDDPYVFPVVDYTDTDDNTIYVDSSTGADGNAGTAAAPKETLLAAINATTAAKTKVVALNTDIYNEDISGGTYTFFQGVYNDGTETSSWVGRQLGFVPGNSNSIFVSKAGNDSTGDGTMETPYLTINYAKGFCDATHQKVGILDSGTYEEVGFEFTGNFTGLYSVIGETPVVLFSRNSNYYTIENSVEETHIFSTTEYQIFDSCVLDNGNIFVVHGRGAANAKYYAVLNPTTGAVVLGDTAVGGNSTESSGVACCKLNNGDVFILYGRAPGATRYLCYCIINGTSYIKTTSETDIYSVATAISYHSCCVYGENVFIVTNNLTNISYMVLSQSDFTQVKAMTNVAGAGYYTACAGLDNGYSVILSYTIDGTRYGYYQIIDTRDWSISTGQTLWRGSYTYRHSVRNINHGKLLFMTGNAFASADVALYYRIMIVDTLAFTSAEVNFGNGVAADGGLLANSNLYMLYTKYADADFYYQVKEQSMYLSNVSVESTLNGVLIRPYDTEILKKLFVCAAALNVIHGKIYAAESSTENVDCTAISSDSHVDITNSIIHDCDIGVDTTEDTSDFSDSQFYRISSGYAIDVDGAAGTGAGINIDHCDLFDCYGGARLQNNDGGEEIKNCIFHDCSVFAIYADTAITLNNSIYTDSTSGVTIGSFVVRANPDYVNEGYIDPDDTDLNIRTKALGYPANSPAYDLADDDRNAGAIDVKYIGTETTYTTITLPKPNTMKVYRQYSGAANTQRKDGSYSSYKDGQSEIVEMTWVGITAAYMTLLLAMWKASNSNVLIYPDPDTYANNFEQWTLLREPVNVGTETPTQSDLGAQGVMLKFARAVE